MCISCILSWGCTLIGSPGPRAGAEPVSISAQPADGGQSTPLYVCGYWYAAGGGGG